MAAPRAPENPGGSVGPSSPRYAISALVFANGAHSTAVRVYNLQLKPEVTMRIVTGVVVALCVIPLTGSAQWLKYPTAGVPRTSAGRPDLTAPAPRTPDGKPDLSGIWDIEHNRPCPAGGCADMEVGQEFV